LPIIGLVALVGLVLLGIQLFPVLFPGASPTEEPTEVASESPTETPEGGSGAGTVEYRGTDSAPMVFVPEGEFTMGSEDGAGDEAPMHTVNLAGYWIDQFEVKNFQYKQCEDAGACSSHRADSSSRESYYGNPDYDYHPVIFVSWDEANAYCSWAGKRLPTEAEWEKAARGTEALIYPWGNDFDITRVNADNVNGDTTQVGDYGPDPYGTYDMAGNVHEWVLDIYSDTYYQTSPTDNPTGPESGDRYVLRGGGWDTNGPDVRTAYRTSNTADYQAADVGFRCAQ
jgi:serine/threonine-protein kinase